MVADMKYDNPVLNERVRTHGDYNKTSYIAQKLKAVINQDEAILRIPVQQRESLDQICTKIARIISGDSNCKEHWEDIKGYAELVLEELNF